MKAILRAAALCACLLLGSCASERDHFYTLNILPEGDRGRLTSPTVHVLLSVSVPSLVDRAEMVLNDTPTGISILDHERWAVALSDQVSQTLARDIERRRNDILIGDRALDPGTVAPVTLKVDIVRMWAKLGGRVSIEAHWRIVDEAARMDGIGSDVFDAPVGAEGFAAVAKSYSLVLSALADRLAAAIPPAQQPAS